MFSSQVLLAFSVLFFLSEDCLVTPWPRFHPTSDIFASNGRLYYKSPRNASPEFCVRDETQAQLQARTCLRKCTSDEDCKSKRKKCLCDGACGLSCIKPEKECGDPESPADLGEVHVNGKMFGSTATYSCPEGFRVIGLESRVCQADGTWSGTAPACKKNIFCTHPPNIDHARHNAPSEQTSFDLDTSLQYQCFPGYTTKGFARTKCFFYNGTAKWFGPDITCEPRSCGQPSDILNGRVEGSCYHYSCKASYNCQPGFELLGGPEYSCQSNGSWIPVDLPTCVPVQCPIPENPVFGKAVFTSVSFNSVVSYECKYGYMLVGEPNRKCGSNKKWEGMEPVCQEINCGSLGTLYNGWIEGEDRTTLHSILTFRCFAGMTFEGPADRSACQSDGSWSHPIPKCLEINCGNPGYLPNGWLELVDGATAIGSSVIFRCFDNMTLVGHSSSVCHTDGSWRHPLPQCLAPCIIPEVAFGNVTMKSEKIVTKVSTDNSTNANKTTHVLLKPGTSIPHGTVIGVRCEKQYEPTHNITPSTCNNGTFTHAPNCQPARCKYLPKAPRHGLVIAPKTEHGMKARFTCHDGFNLIGINVSECQFGNWIGEPPMCNQSYCKFPGNITDGKVMLVGNMGWYDYRNYVTKVANNRQITFECDKGYVLQDGPQWKTCVSGVWAPKTEVPRCVKSKHPSYRWVRSISRKRRAIKPGGGNIVRNKVSGAGGGGGAGARRQSRRKKITSGDDTDGDDDDTHYEITCATLDHDPFIQTEVLQNGEFDNNETYSAGAVLKVSCTQGYGVNLQNQTVKCVQGEWKPKLPQCHALPCKTPHINHASCFEGSKALYFQEFVKHEKTIDVRCIRGYQLVGHGKLVCKFSEWEGNFPPECVPAQCTLPPIQYGNYLSPFRSGMRVPHETEVSYSCSGDFRKVTDAIIKCSLGELSPHKPYCIHPNFMDEGSDMIESIDKRKKVSRNMHNVFPNTKRQCTLPPEEKGAIAFVEGRPVDFEEDVSFPNGTDVLYKCFGDDDPTVNKTLKKNRWKISCEDGVWIGTSLPCDGDLADEILPALLDLINSSCIIESRDPNIVIFFNNKEITNNSFEFPTGSIITSRCVDIGKYEMAGSIRRKCVSGQLLGITPKCMGMSQLNDYALDKSPTILFRHSNGSIGQSNDGKLVVFPGTTLHMECLWIRKYGSPKWNYSTNSSTDHVAGWTDDIPDRFRDLEFRLTIENAQPEDSGIYTCTTPARHSHRVIVVVKAITCEPLPVRSDLLYSTTDNQMGTVVNFTCNNSHGIIGPKKLHCLANGEWSGTLPKCESIYCPHISLIPAMAPLAFTSVTKNGVLKRNETAPPRISINGRKVGSKAHFNCPEGYVVHGASEATCLASGDWSSAIPLCKEIECTEPPQLEFGSVSAKLPYKAGDLAQYECNQGFMMEGTQAIIACQDNGKWSRQSDMKCVQACTYPGSIIGGSISPVRFYYKVQETVSFQCVEGRRLVGVGLLHCLKNGKWSSSIPTCLSP